MVHYFNNILTLIKNGISQLVLIIIAFLAPIAPLLLTVGVFIAIDTFMGVWRARTAKEPVTSRKFSAIVSKFILYQSAIILFFILEKFVIGDFIVLFTDIPHFLVKLMAALLCGIELMSINESFIMIKGFSLWDKAKELLKRTKYIKDEFENLKKDGNK